MSQEALEPSTPPVQQADRDTHIVYRALDSYPDRLFAHDMAAIYCISLARFYRLSGEGAFDFALIKPQTGRQSWSRNRVRQHLDGELRGLTPARKR